MTTPLEATVLPADDAAFGMTVPVAIVGAGACGLIAALSAVEQGAEVVVFERDPSPSGSTSLSSGFIPAAGTRFQAAKNIADSPAQLAADVVAKNGGESDPAMVEVVCQTVGPALEWLADRHEVPFEVLDSFLYPGHSALRMHATPRHTGADLMAYLIAAVERACVDVVTSARVTTLFTGPDGAAAGVRIARPDGGTEDIGCAALVLACNGYGGDPALVRTHMPEIADAVFFGHTGNTGDALRWGEALGADPRDLGSYQGHGSIAQGHNILITWALMTEGGFQVNADGRRFSNEHDGYSEQAVRVMAQPGGVAWDIYDARLHALGMEFEDYRDAVDAGAPLTAETPQDLANAAGLPADALVESLDHTEAMARGEAQDPFGRDFTAKPPLAPPYYAVKVTGALFHTQGGLAVDTKGRVLRRDGAAIPNIFAGGGAARGLSGSSAPGYLSGSGLLTAVALGRICGVSAGKLAGDTA